MMNMVLNFEIEGFENFDSFLEAYIVNIYLEQTHQLQC